MSFQSAIKPDELKSYPPMRPPEKPPRLVP
jgi:hypothetical protein